MLQVDRTEATSALDQANRVEGVGIDLTMAYVAVAIKFENGTTRDIARVDGSPEYLAAMRSVAEDARQFHGLGPAVQLTYETTRTFYPPLFVMEWWWEFRAWYTTTDTHIPPDPYQPDKWVDIVADTLSAIKSDILAPLNLQGYDHVFTTWPDFEANTGSLYKMRFRLACQRAGLQHLDGDVASYHALQYDGIPADQDEDLDLAPSGPRAMLVINSNAASLGVTLVVREVGMLWPRRLVESPEHGAALCNGSTYWESVKALLDDVIQDEPVDHILLLGSHAYDADLIRAVYEVIGQHANINSSILDRYRASALDLELNLRDGDLPVFMAARRGAGVARGTIKARPCETGQKATRDVHLEL
ncbi:hypothetical protein BJY00DRAFT_318007 [Aspergillus carlsbadensis]|nr:hypothetical protein BJY00DRAFT_318007 [Aspergillus carlsbadensis]